MTPTPPDDWRLSAACATTPLLMFPTSNAGIVAAKRVCARCPVARECGADAIRMEAMPGVRSYGVRGGMSGKERRMWLNGRAEREEGVG